MSVYTELNEACRMAGTNLNKICSKEGIDRSILERWKKNDPKSIRIYKKLTAAIEQSKVERVNPEHD